MRQSIRIIAIYVKSNSIIAAKFETIADPQQSHINAIKIIDITASLSQQHYYPLLCAF